jgi:hypothetical protein
VSWLKLGDVRTAQGDLAGALVAYEASRAIAERLAGSDPGNAAWQRDLALSWERVASVREKEGDREGALEAWRRALALSLPMARRFADSVDMVTTPVVHLAGVARTLAAEDAAGRLDATRAGWADWLEEEMGRLGSSHVWL